MRLVAFVVSCLGALAAVTCSNVCWDPWRATEKEEGDGLMLSFALAGHGVSG